MHSVAHGGMFYTCAGEVHSIYMNNDNCQVHIEFLRLSRSMDVLGASFYLQIIGFFMNLLSYFVYHLFLFPFHLSFASLLFWLFVFK